MEFYFSDRIDITGIILDLALVILTTGVTYYLFSALPAKRRKRLLLESLYQLEIKLFRDILDHKTKFERSYNTYQAELRATEILPDKKEGCFSVELIDFDSFLKDSLNKFPTVEEFSDSWQVNEIPHLITSIILDDQRYMEILTDLSSLKRGLAALNIFKEKYNDGTIHSTEKERKEQLEALALKSINYTYSMAENISLNIDSIFE